MRVAYLYVPVRFVLWAFAPGCMYFLQSFELRMPSNHPNSSVPTLPPKRYSKSLKATQWRERSATMSWLSPIFQRELHDVHSSGCLPCRHTLNSSQAAGEGLEGIYDPSLLPLAQTGLPGIVSRAQIRDLGSPRSLGGSKK